MKEFVHLHVHTEYSLLDGLARISKLVDITKERGWKAVAITDHGNMYGAIKMYEKCVEEGIKPILGCEFYICHDRFNKTDRRETCHLILIAKNNVGYGNLLKLNGIAYTEGFYGKPRIDFKSLQEHSEGLICLSACLVGNIPRLIIQRRFDEAEELALWFKNIFKDDYYFEIQDHGIPEEREVLIKLAEMSKKLDIPLVATNDVHYLNREDAELQDVLMCVQMRKTVDDPNRMKFSTDQFYYKTYEEMLEKFEGFEDALDRTIEIANKCDVIIKTKSLGEKYGVDERYKLPQNKNHIPDYIPSTGETPFEFLKRLSYEGLHRLYSEITPELLARMEEELTTIKSQGFVEYFLIVWDYINFARENDIPVGPGRGSGAGSLVAYCSGITQVDPIKYQLLFERFINKERVSMPDFDVDFCPDRCQEVIDYTKSRYGADHVSNIITFGTMAAKNAVRDVARVLRVPISEVNKLTKEIPGKVPDGLNAKKPVLKFYFGRSGDPSKDKYIIPELARMYEEDEVIRKVVDMAIKLEGVPRNTSMHAAGVLIAPEPVVNYVPIALNSGDVVTQFDMIELEHLGLLKMDFLRLKTLTDIYKAIKYVKEDHGIDIDFHKMEYDDPKVYELIASGNTDAIFQLESGGMKKFMQDLAPTCLDDIIAGISMYRPGPMDSIPRFVECKKNPEKIFYEDECLKPILEMTYGCIVYQEQVMKIFQEMGGYSLGQADNIRRIMGKKQVEKIAAEKVKFIDGWEDPSGKASIPGAVKLGHDRDVAANIFDKMAEFAKYAFNKSHAAAYAYVGYQTAYLKCYYEVEFLTAVLNNRITNADDIKKYTAYAKKEGFKILPPDINNSFTEFKVENGNIRFGLAGLRNVGGAVVELIIAERNANGPYKSLEDFVARADSLALNKRCLESLIMSGAFDCFGKHRSQLMEVYAIAVERANKDNKSKQSGQFSLFDSIGEIDNSFNQLDYPNIKEFNKETLLKKEKEVVGLYLSGHPLDDYLDKFDSFTLTSDMLGSGEEKDEEDEEVEEVETENETQFEEGQPVICGGIIIQKNKKITKQGNKELAFLKIEDIYGTIEVAIMPNVYPKVKDIIEEDSMITVKGKISLRNETPGVIADAIIPWENTNAPEQHMSEIKRLCLKCDTKNFDTFEKVKKALSSYPGDSEVLIKCSSTNTCFKYGTSTVGINNYLLNELYGILGESNVIVK